MSQEPLRQRYSKLAPLSVQDQENLARAALHFFSPTFYEQNCEIISRSPTPGRTEPLDGADFLKFLENTGTMKEPGRYRDRIAELLARLERVGLLVFLGHGTDIFLGKRYYFLKELTLLEKQGFLWLSQALGPQFIRNQYCDFTVQITGSTEAGDIHAGTGLVLTSDLVLTCAHVLQDMNVDKVQNIRGKQYSVVEVLPHSHIDVGLLRFEPELHVHPALVFRDPHLSETLYTLGYPRVPLACNAPLVMQSGEVTAPEVTLFDGVEVFLFSAVARPGNSGGPIVSSSGHVVGIVTQELTETKVLSAPFYAGIRSSTVQSALIDLDPSFALPMESYS